MNKFITCKFLKKVSNSFIKNKFSVIKLITISIIVFLTLSFILLSSISCSQINEAKNFIVSKFSNDKEADKMAGIVKEFFNALIKKDYDKAYDYVYIKAGGGNSLSDFKDELKNATDIVSIEVNSVEIKNNIAVVVIDLIDSYDGDEKIYKDLEVSLVKVNGGDWKINFWDYK